MKCRNKETLRSGFKLTWFIKNPIDSNLDENSDLTTNQAVYLTKMATTAKQARVNNVTRSEIIDIAIQEKTEMVRTGRLKYATMCYGGLLRENSYKAVFEEISIDPSPECLNNSC